LLNSFHTQNNIIQVVGVTPLLSVG